MPIKNINIASEESIECLMDTFGSQLGRHVIGEGLDSLGVATLAQNVVVQRETSSPFGFRRQYQAAVFAFVARDVKATIQGHHSDGFFLPRFGHDRQFTNATSRRKLFVEIFDAVDAVGGVDRERNAVQAFAAYDACETRRMIRFARGTQNPVEDRLSAHRTFFESVQIVFFAIRFPVQWIERFPLQVYGADAASETTNVVDSVHGGAAGCLADDSLSALDAHSVHVAVFSVAHGSD